MCNKITKPEFTKEQIAECKQCKHISGKKIWCCLFGVWVDGRPEKGIIQPRRNIIKPGDKIKWRRPSPSGLPSFISGCCDKAKNIALGWKRYLAGEWNEIAEKRMQICYRCDEITWLTKVDYAAWLAKKNIKVIKNFNQLEKLPKLIKKPQTSGTEPYCCICKCFLKAKVLVETEKCQLGKW